MPKNNPETVEKNEDWVIPGSEELGKKLDAFEKGIKQNIIVIHDAIGRSFHSIFESFPVFGRLLKAAREDAEQAKDSEK